MQALRALPISILAACTFTNVAGGDVAGDGGAEAIDAPALPLGPFATPVPIAMLQSSATDSDPSLTADMLEIYFRSNRAGGMGGDDVWMASRSTVAGDWSAPVNVPVVNSGGAEREPAISADGLTLRFSRANNIYQATRATRTSSWSAPVMVPELAGFYDAHEDASGLLVVGSGFQPGNEDLYLASRSDPRGLFGTPGWIGELNTGGTESGPYVFAGGRAICFDAYYGATHRELYVAYRPSTAVPFETPQPLAELNSTAWDSDCWMSPDQRTIYLASERNGARQLFVAMR